MKINRRKFFGLTAAAGLGLATYGFTSSYNLFSTSEAARTEAEFELLEASIGQLQELMGKGLYTSRKLVELYNARIENIDKKGPKLHSVLELNPDALTIADALDKERKEKGSRGPLHGIPLLLKDNIDTADHMNTTAGSLALLGAPPAHDAFIVERLRAAGAVILGKTNLSEWANFRSTKATSGWSGRGGQCKNPYVLDRNPSGSSSGSGTAVSANLAVAAIGTETDGSITSPSSVNGLVGIKPTVGLLSRSGIVPISHSQDTPGPMTRTVADAAILLGAMVGIDERDSATRSSQGKSFTDYTQFLDAQGLRGARIGIARNFFGFSSAVDKLMLEALAAIKQAGATIIEQASIPAASKIDAPELEVLLYEFKADLNAYLATRPDLPVKTLKDLIEYNNKHADKEMPYFGQELFIMAEAKGPLTERKYLQALATSRRLAGKEGIDAVMSKDRLDALVAPTCSAAWVTDLINGDHYTGSCTTPAAVAGYPHITVPAGYINGLPVGISFFGTAYSEAKLIKLAYSFEQITNARHAPRFLATLDL